MRSPLQSAGSDKTPGSTKIIKMPKKLNRQIFQVLFGDCPLENHFLCHAFKPLIARFADILFKHCNILANVLIEYAFSTIFTLCLSQHTRQFPVISVKQNPKALPIIVRAHLQRFQIIIEIAICLFQNLFDFFLSSLFCRLLSKSCVLSACFWQPNTGKRAKGLGLV